MATRDTWESNHFSLSNARGSEGANLPLLLRRLADEIERRDLNPAAIVATTIGSTEVTEDGPWWAATVVWGASQ